MSLAAQHGAGRAGAESVSEETGDGKCPEITFSGTEQVQDPWLALSGCSQPPWKLLVT